MSEWPLIPAGIAVLAGCGLVLFGLRAPRRGDGRSCRRCRYNLTGLISPLCPECGSDLAAPRAVVVGQRSIRRKPLAAGFALLLIGTPLLLGVGGRAVWELDWWRVAPTELLLRSASSGSTSARREIDRRLRNDALDGAMSTQALEAASRVALSMRKRMVCDDFYSARIVAELWPELSWGGVWIDSEVLAIRIDGQIQRVDALDVVRRRATVRFEEPGEHVVEVDVRVLWKLPTHDPLSMQRTLRETVTAVAPGAIDDVELVRSSDLDESLDDAISVEELNLAGVAEDGWWEEARLRARPPIDLALRVEADHDGKRIWIGDVTFQKAQPRVARWLRCAPRKIVEQAFGILPERCDLVFRGDKSAARATSDLSQIWGGELRVRDVPLRDSLRGR